MAQKLILTLLLVAISYSASITLLDTPWNSAPESLSMEHILNILRYEVGEATTAEINSSANYIKQLVQGQIKNKTIIYLMDNSKINAQIRSVPITNYLQSKVPSKIWKQVAEYLPSLVKPSSAFSIVDGANLTINDIQQKQPSISRIVIWADSEQHQKIKQLLSQPKRLLQAANDSSYLIKFFFSILFIFVCFGVLYSIANMKNQRQTLLYAKFVADVGGR